MTNAAQRGRRGQPRPPPIRGLGGEPGPSTFANRRQLLDSLRRDSPHGCHAARASEQLQDADGDDARRKRRRGLADVEISPQSSSEEGARGQPASTYFEPHEIRCLRSFADQPAEAHRPGAGDQGPVGGGWRQLSGANALDASVAPPSNEDAKMHYGSCGADSANASLGEAEDMTSASDGATARGLMGGPNYAAGNAAAQWAWHAHHRQGEGDEPRRLSKG